MFLWCVKSHSGEGTAQVKEMPPQTQHLPKATALVIHK